MIISLYIHSCSVSFFILFHLILFIILIFLHLSLWLVCKYICPSDSLFISFLSSVPIPPPFFFLSLPLLLPVTHDGRLSVLVISLPLLGLVFLSTRDAIYDTLSGTLSTSCMSCRFSSSHYFSLFFLSPHPLFLSHFPSLFPFPLSHSLFLLPFLVSCPSTTFSIFI